MPAGVTYPAEPALAGSETMVVWLGPFRESAWHCRKVFSGSVISGWDELHGHCLNQAENNLCSLNMAVEGDVLETGW